MKKIFYTCFILSLSYYSINYAQSTMTPDGNYVGGDNYSSTPYCNTESTNNTFGQ